jgi:hypothetical protein
MISLLMKFARFDLRCMAAMFSWNLEGETDETEQQKAENQRAQPSSSAAALSSSAWSGYVR